MGQGFRPFGYILRSHVFRSGESAATGLSTCVIEPEFCLTVAEPLEGDDVTRERARDAVGSIAAAFELCQTRLPTGLPDAIRLGDRVSQWGIVIGDELPAAIDPLAVTIETVVDGVAVDRGRFDPDAMDDPYLALARLCRTLAQHGRRLEPGQQVITGSLLPPRPVPVPAAVRADFGGFGTVSIELR